MFEKEKAMLQSTMYNNFNILAENFSNRKEFSFKKEKKFIAEKEITFDRERI